MHEYATWPAAGKARRLLPLLLAAAACLLMACSTTPTTSTAPTLYDMLSTANVERVDGGVTFVNFSTVRTGYSYPYGAVYPWYQPSWLGAYSPYYGLYYPYYGYRPWYVWDYYGAPGPWHPYRRPLHPYPDGHSSPVEPDAPGSVLPPVYTGPVDRIPYQGLDPAPGYVSARAYGSSASQISSLERPTGNLGKYSTEFKFQPDAGKVGHGFQRPDPVRIPDLSQQRVSPGYGARASSGSMRISAPRTRYQSRPSRAPAGHSSGVSGTRPEPRR